MCCPHVNDPLRAADGQRCGVPSVQGQGYDGVGSYPWVARIGFRSTNYLALLHKRDFHFTISQIH